MTRFQYRWRTTVTFLIVYCAVYVASVLGAARFFAATLAPGAALIEPYEGRLIVALLVSAVVSALLGNLAASIQVSSYFGLGPDHMTPLRFFGTGWLSILVANGLAATASLVRALPREVGLQWLKIVGIERYNLVMLVAVPSIAYLTGVIAVVLVERIFEAQRS